ncbi:hypothetical protein niasHT_017735 [Heterodera trifolii]|uniref:Uncharacterized protein n=1 Tax=Heterodera trifolii TaxID=157864 RepID=A0ABD2L6V2_9BILA
MPPASMPAWARQWQKFFVERAGIDSLHFGLLLLMLLSLIMLFLTIMSVFIRFCCCTRRPPRHRKCSTSETLPKRTSSNGGFFSGTNEERRCLLQPNGICAGQAQQKQENAKTEEQQKMEQRDGQAVAGTKADDSEQLAQSFRQQPIAENVTTIDETITPPKCQPSCSTPLMAHRGQLLPPHRTTTAHLPAESPPPPRRFATGGRTQVLPLTAQNCRRVTPLVMLMADQQQQQHRQQQIARGRMPTTSADSRATTTTGTNSAMKSCATIHEDPEEMNRLLSDELLSIDRTFVSVGDEQLQQQHMYYAAHRLPINQPPPTFEVQPPSYSPPEPPNNKPLTINICRESINFSRCSYGGAQTPLNTTTGSSSADPSVDSILNGCGRRGAQVRISELESEINADGTPNCANAGAGHLESSCHAALCRRVPRSISQQLELMNMAQQQPSPDQQQ